MARIHKATSRLGAVAALVLACAAPMAQAQYNIIHFDMQENCVRDSVTDRIYGTFYEGGEAAARSLGNQLSVDVTDSGNMSFKSQQSVEDVMSTIDFFGQLGWNAAGTSEPLLLLSNLADSDCDGMNAWYTSVGNNGHMMAIYYGHPDARDSMAKDYDFASHEYGHGFFRRHQRSDTHEVGAINESVADMFGAAYKAWMSTGKNLDTLVARQDSYLVGEYWAQVMRDYYNYDVTVMRDMSDPAAGGDPDYYNARQARQTPIHSLAGVTNLGFYLMAQGGTHPRGASNIQVQGIGVSKSIQLVYYAFAHRIPFSDMPEFGDAIRKAAIRVYGADSVEFYSADAAFKAVGLESNLPATLTNPQPSQPAATQPESQPESQPSTESQSQPESQPQPDTQPTSTEQGTNGDANTNPPHQGPAISGPAFMAALLAIIVICSIWLAFLGRQKKGGASVTVAETYESASSGKSMLKRPAPTPQPQQQKPTPAPRPVITPAPKPPEQPAIAAVIRVQGQSFALSIDASPLTLGRSSELELPNALKALFANDAHMSRKHCAIWCKAATRELYVQSLSDNPLTLEDHPIATRSKVKVTFDRPVTLLLGETTVIIEPST